MLYIVLNHVLLVFVGHITESLLHRGDHFAHESTEVSCGHMNLEAIGSLVGLDIRGFCGVTLSRGDSQLEFVFREFEETRVQGLDLVLLAELIDAVSVLTRHVR